MSGRVATAPPMDSNDQAAKCSSMDSQSCHDSALLKVHLGA